MARGPKPHECPTTSSRKRKFSSTQPSQLDVDEGLPGNEIDTGEEQVSEKDADEPLSGPFPGGPHDPSVLKSFKSQVAAAIWFNKERDPLKLQNHSYVQNNCWSLCILQSPITIVFFNLHSPVTTQLRNPAKLLRLSTALFMAHTTSPSGFTYDGLLSFRGEDTRKNFISHLYTALVNARYRTFMYDSELERGENIKETLVNAIQQSQSSVIVFSEDYTFSRWCLDELVMILERKRTSDHAVLPVFYKVDPSAVRKQAKSFAGVLKYHENQSSEKLNEWRAALREVADLAGMVSENEADGYACRIC